MQPPSKYARIERERRFLLNRFPSNPDVIRISRISDYYINGTTLRLREQRQETGPTVFKLTQKLPAPANGAQQGFITTIYLTEAEFRVFAQLPANRLCKTRYSIPPFGIDKFEGALEGLLTAEVEFDSADAADALALPSWGLKEISTDNRFTGGILVRASRDDVGVGPWSMESNSPHSKAAE
jgi:CYTH domain-containing protein